MRLFAFIPLLLLAACAEQSPPVAVTAPTPPQAGVPTEATKAANAAVAEKLPLGDRGDFEDATRGLVARIEDGIIRNEAGRVVWDASAYAFLDGPAPESVNPSLWRQAQLNAVHGLFEVTDGVWQARGYDLAVMTLIRGESGWIIIDPLLSRETAAAALALANEALGARPVAAVIFTHSHSDHFGGVRGVVSEEDVASGRVRIIAPAGFEKHAISENVLAGPHMARRASLQFGTALEAGPLGRVDSGIGKTLSSGSIGYMRPTETVEAAREEKVIDGVRFVFVNTPETEAPSEFMIWLPEKKALCSVELATNTLHNVLTLRGAEARDALAWSKYLGQAIADFSEAEIVFASHGWPTWGRENVRAYLENHRDVYRFLHDQTLRRANMGATLHEVADDVSEPAFMQEDFSTRGYYGTLNHNMKATYQRYFGWWDGVPANLNPHPPEALGARYVALAGGADAIIAAAAEAFEAGDYRWSATLANHLVFAEPENAGGRAYLAASYEQLGFQAESAIWRNYFLAAAKELREGVAAPETAGQANAEFVRAIPTDLFFDAMAVRLNPERAFDVAIDFTFTDTGERLGVSVRDGVAMQRAGGLAAADLSIAMRRADFDAVTLGAATIPALLASGAITVDGNPATFGRFLLAHDQFDPAFNVAAP